MNKDMFIIGITGGTGAGKTSALRALKTFGALVLDCDEIYHELLAGNADLKSDLAARFGGVLSDGGIDRKRLGEIVFNDPAALLDLNAITHRYVDAELEMRLNDWRGQGGTIAAIDAIALIESGLREKCDVVVGVTAPVETRISRIMRRDGISRERAEMRVNAQKPDSYYQENSDYMLVGRFETSAEFERECEDFFKGILPLRRSGEK